MSWVAQPGDNRWVSASHPQRQHREERSSRHRAHTRSGMAAAPSAHSSKAGLATGNSKSGPTTELMTNRRPPSAHQAAIKLRTHLLSRPPSRLSLPLGPTPPLLPPPEGPSPEATMSCRMSASRCRAAAASSAYVGGFWARVGKSASDRHHGECKGGFSPIVAAAAATRLAVAARVPASRNALQCQTRQQTSRYQRQPYHIQPAGRANRPAAASARRAHPLLQRQLRPLLLSEEHWLGLRLLLSLLLAQQLLQRQRLQEGRAGDQRQATESNRLVAHIRGGHQQGRSVLAQQLLEWQFATTICGFKGREWQ